MLQTTLLGCVVVDNFLHLVVAIVVNTRFVATAIFVAAVAVAVVVIVNRRQLH